MRTGRWHIASSWMGTGKGTCSPLCEQRIPSLPTGWASDMSSLASSFWGLSCAARLHAKTFLYCPAGTTSGRRCVQCQTPVILVIPAVVIDKALIDLIRLHCWTEHSCSELCYFLEDIKAALTCNMHITCTADDRWAAAAAVAKYHVACLVITAAEPFHHFTHMCVQQLANSKRCCLNTYPLPHLTCCRLCPQLMLP